MHPDNLYKIKPDFEKYGIRQKIDFSDQNFLKLLVTRQFLVDFGLRLWGFLEVTTKILALVKISSIFCDFSQNLSFF